MKIFFAGSHYFTPPFVSVSYTHLLGYSDYAKPGSSGIYPKSFEAKNRIVDSLNAYNAAMRAQGEEDKVIVFSDTVGTLMSAVTRIVDMVSNVLVAFVAISLVVSSIMIGVITYISVLERRKEIGILPVSYTHLIQAELTPLYIAGLPHHIYMKNQK